MQQVIRAHYSDHWLVTRHDVDDPGSGGGGGEDDEEDQGWPSSAGFMLRRKHVA